MGSIYKITNTVNGKAYIGKTAYDAVKSRIRKHLHGRGSKIIKSAIAKYGKDAFVYEILHDGIIPELLDSYEIESIKKHGTLQPNGYNLTIGGEGVIGYKFTAEQLQKLSESHKGYRHSDKTRQKMSLAHKGKKYNLGSKWSSSESRKKRGERWIGSKNPRANPFYTLAKQFYASLPSSMSASDIRKHLRKEFPMVMSETIWKWVKKWQSETD